jgi:hypothetical protein
VDESVSTSSTSAAPSSHGEIVAALSSGAATLTPSADPKPASAAPSDGAVAPTGSPPVAPGSPDPRTPPIAAAADPDADLSTPPVGPIPPDRHKKILERTREKVAQETRAAFEQEHGPWLRLKSEFTVDEFAGLMPTLKNLTSNPRQFLQDTARELGLQLVPLGPPAAQEAPARAGGEEPPPDLQLPDGTLLYSAAQQGKREQWFRDQIKGDFAKEMQPFRDQQQQQQQHAFLSHIDARARADYAEVAEMEGFADLKPKIAEIMANDKRYGLQGAYLRAYKESYLPTRDTKIRQAVMDELTQKSRAASSSLTPTRRATADQAAPPPTSTADIMRQKAAELGIAI